MGKKQIDVLNKMYPKFIEGGRKNNLNEERLEKIWNDWKAFAEYAFNKSHSTCYAFCLSDCLFKSQLSGRIYGECDE
jgi:DNA polymerase-3 subunit alpha